MSSNPDKLKMAAVGDYESVLPFQAVGIDPFIMEQGEDEQLRNLLKQLLQERYAVVFLVDRLYETQQEFIRELNESYPVSILPVPGVQGSTGIGAESIRASVERAVGMDIFSVE